MRSRKDQGCSEVTIHHAETKETGFLVLLFNDSHCLSVHGQKRNVVFFFDQPVGW